MSATDVIQEGDSVVFYFSMTNIGIVPKITDDGTTHNACGFFYHSDMIGKPYGSKIHPRLLSENPRPVHVLRVTPELFTLSIPHRTQIIYHADISMIMMGLDILPGSVVAEAGTGSASLSFSIAYTVAPSGRLHTFEIDSSRAEHNRKLRADVLPEGVVTVSERDVVAMGFPQELSVDAVFLDLPSPWLVITSAAKILKENGRICTFSPSVEQVTKNVEALKHCGFHEVRTVEVMLKPWGLDISRDPPFGSKRTADGTEKNLGGMKSFQLPMRGHTSYLTFAIKKLHDEEEYLLPILSLSAISNSLKNRQNEL
jgi:tRNA (adenine57-N1/adenine58-N1)-methyltransferase